MLESDADRLASIKGLGGQLVRAEGGDFYAIFDSEFSLASFTDGPGVSSSSPQLTCRTSDARRFGFIENGSSLELEIDGDTKHFTVREHQPDGTGMSVLVLDAEE